MWSMGWTGSTSEWVVKGCMQAVLGVLVELNGSLLIWST